MSRPAVFLDRDGTINVEKEYLHRIEDWEWIPGAIEAIRLINRMGYLAIVVTNQAGIARGYYDEAAVHSLHDQVDALLASEGARIDAYYYCPHHPEFGDVRVCECRKPGTGMLMAAQRDFDIDLENSYLIGDKALDIESAQKMDVRPILIMTGYGKEQDRDVSAEVIRRQDILAAVEYIEKQSENAKRIHGCSQ